MQWYVTLHDTYLDKSASRLVLKSESIFHFGQSLELANVWIISTINSMSCSTPPSDQVGEKSSSAL